MGEGDAPDTDGRSRQGTYFVDPIRQIDLNLRGMGLGLVRLLQQAGRIEEARTTLSSLENAFQGVTAEVAKSRQRPSKTKRWEGVTRTPPCSSESASTRVVPTEIRPRHGSIA